MFTDSKGEEGRQRFLPVVILVLMGIYREKIRMSCVQHKVLTANIRRVSICGILKGKKERE